MDPTMIITTVGWLATPLMTRLVNLVRLRNPTTSRKLNLLKQSLYSIQKRAENAQIINLKADIHTLREWLWRFKDAIYDAEDVIYSDKPDKKQIDDILDNFQQLTDDIKAFLEKLSKRDEIPTWRKTTYLMSRSIRGRTSEIKDLKSWLLSDQSTNPRKNFSLLSIIGTGGIGKTGLSQLVFDDQEVQEKFEVTAWVFLCKVTRPSIKFKPNSASLDERSQTNYCTDSADTLGEFQNKFESRMIGKRFFIVLDDVWELPTNWDSFYWPLFNCGEKGSKIIVTTQLEGIANMIDSDEPMKMNVLRPDEYWELFKECTFGNNNPPSHCSVLENVGLNISNRFGCSPLAAVEVGRELKRSVNHERWNLISRNKFCIVDRTDGDIISILGFCYEQLPERLKQCYLSCALFPRNYLFDKEELNLIWIGLGFLLSESDPTNYVDDLSKRSFLLRETSTNSRYAFHYVLHELAEYISDEEFHRLEQRIEHIEIPRHTRHVYINANNFVEASEALGNNRKLRSLVIVGGLSTPDEEKTFMKSLKEVTKNLKFLRFLVLPVAPKDLSKTVGNLTYLRFLQFPKNQRQKLLKLPKSMLEKYKLKLWGDSTYLLVSKDIDKLIKLTAALQIL